MFKRHDQADVVDLSRHAAKEECRRIAEDGGKGLEGMGLGLSAQPAKTSGPSAVDELGDVTLPRGDWRLAPQMEAEKAPEQKYSPEILARIMSLRGRV